MVQHRHRAGRLRSLRTSVALGGVGALAGLLFATNAGIGAPAADRGPMDLSDLVRAENARMQETAQEVNALRAEVDGLIGSLAQDGPDTEAPPAVAFAAGRTAVQGPGVRIEMWDAPYSTVPEGFRGDDLVVHQQDLHAVINALRAGGAEAIAVQGHRVTATTAIRCVGNVLLIDGETYSPPYVIEAIGDATAMQAAVLNSEPVQAYLYYVEAVRLGWSLAELEEIPIPGFGGSPGMSHARVPGHEPYLPPGDTPPVFGNDGPA